MYSPARFGSVDTDAFLSSPDNAQRDGVNAALSREFIGQAFGRWAGWATLMPLKTTARGVD